MSNALLKPSLRNWGLSWPILVRPNPLYLIWTHSSALENRGQEQLTGMGCGSSLWTPAAPYSGIVPGQAVRSRVAQHCQVCLASFSTKGFVQPCGPHANTAPVSEQQHETPKMPNKSISFPVLSLALAVGDCLQKNSFVCPTVWQSGPWIASEVPGEGQLALAMVQQLLEHLPLDLTWLEVLICCKTSGKLPGTAVKSIILWHLVCAMKTITIRVPVNLSWKLSICSIILRGYYSIRNRCG